ncbi:winged helix-turn-helix domain-containing protein [Falsibacillus pallidus]|uniref:Transcriptional regulator n=1 Tax=Falsibacillus pallidus TaxID=493781 RepID=A0A370GDE2_9BACI|nr:winged helix-turn-helix domain-containing protein [Falsibacillus pallidus]RDI41845.1 transcriptional regulator [Falsibacillus pallidus]
MKNFQFDRSDYAVSFNGERVVLLPKEYHLLHYLFEHLNQTLSREALLDGVWPMEAPTDRTVDDHVYRLRKKLAAFDRVAIETVRGTGYRLKIKQTHEDNPLSHDQEFKESMDVLFRKYILFGQGTGLKSIASQHDALAIPIEIHKKVYLHFVNGDFRWFVLDSPDVPFSQKLFYLLHIYGIIQFRFDQTCMYAEKALQSNVLPWVQHQEFDVFGMIGIYLNNGDFEQAARKINFVHSKMDAGEMNKDISTFIKVQEIKLALASRQSESLESHFAAGDQLFHNYPYLREKGRYLMLKGFANWMNASRKEGLQLMDEGFATLGTSKFVPNMVNGVKDMMDLGRHLSIEVPKEYQAKWDTLSKQHDFKGLATELERLFRQSL